MASRTTSNGDSPASAKAEGDYYEDSVNPPRQMQHRIAMWENRKTSERIWQQGNFASAKALLGKDEAAHAERKRGKLAVSDWEWKAQRLNADRNDR